MWASLLHLCPCLPLVLTHGLPGPDSSPLPGSPPPAPVPGPVPPPLTTGTTSAHASITPLSAVSSLADTSPIAGETSSRRTTSKLAGSFSSDGFLCSTSTASPSSTLNFDNSMTPMPVNTVVDTRHRILSLLAIAGSSIRLASIPFAVEFAHAGPGPKPPLSRLSRLTSSFASTPSRSSRDGDSRYMMTSRFTSSSSKSHWWGPLP
ncbi:hypothetical protein B0H14DRAFT_2921390 [Mycena olivaceomarginata]|nr:hypothetical protein B0H14DRAFT_2921390 [Mycena olivaceomarginata]